MQLKVDLLAWVLLFWIHSFFLLNLLIYQEYKFHFVLLVTH